MDVEPERPKAPDKNVKPKQNGMEAEREDEGIEIFKAPSSKYTDRSGRKETSLNEGKSRQPFSHKYERDDRNNYFQSRQDGSKGERGKETNRRSTSRGSYATSSNSSIAGQTSRDRRYDDGDKRGYSEKTGKRDDSQSHRSRHPGPAGYDRKGDRDGKDQGKGYIEDPLFKLMKRIIRVGFDRERRLTSARQLKDYLHGPEVKSLKSPKQLFDAVDALQNVLFERGTFKELKHEVALCIGLLGSSLDQEIPRFFEWAFDVINSSEGDVKCYICTALLEMMHQPEAQQKSTDLIGNVMVNVMHLLDSTSLPNLFMVTMDIVVVLAETYPHVFTSFFRDAVDTVIGWLIDVTSGPELVEHLCSCLVQLHPFWVSDIQFSFMMLTQFTEDLEMFLGGDMARAEQGLGDHTVETLTNKVAYLLKVYYTVMLCLGENIGVLRGGPLNVEYFSEPLKKVVLSLGPTVTRHKSDAITILGNDTIRLLLHQLLSAVSATSCGDLILPYVICQTDNVVPLKDPVAISLIRLLQKVVEVYSTQLPVYILMHLLGPHSVLPSLRFSLCPQIVTELLSLYHSLLALKSVPLLEEAYRLVLSDTEVAYNTLLREGARPALKFVGQGSNPWADYIYSARQAQQAILFNIGALAEIANTKSNLIGMWALSPSIFTLLSSNLMITDTWMNKHEALVIYTVVNAFYSHCTRHANFLSSSVLLTSANPLDTSRMVGMSQATNQNFTRIIQIIVTMLNNTATGFDSRCLLMKWTSEILHALTSTPLVYTSPSVRNLMAAIILQGYHNEQQVFQCASHCMKTAFSSQAKLFDEVVKNCLELCMYRLSDARKGVRETFLALLKLLPLDKLLNTDLFEGEEEWMASDRREHEFGMRAMWHARRAHMASPPSGTFHSHNFRHIMAYILSGTQPGQCGSFHWLEAMYYARQRSGGEKGRSDSSDRLAGIIDNNECLLWFWATWECAQFAILARLRTPLGKAPETFVAIESVIKAFAVETQNLDALEDSTEKRENARSEKVGDYTCLQRVHLLLTFMENLDKLLYNAYEGCSVAMPALHKVVKTFFRTNRHTCLEWLSRIRMSLLTIAVHSGMWACAVRQGFELLRDLEDAGTTHVNSPVFEQALVYVVQALCELWAPDSIVGVYHWCHEVTGQTLPWILAMADKANKRYEKAATDFQASLTSMMTSQHCSKGKPGSKSENTEDVIAEDTDQLSGKENSRPKEQNSSPSMATIRFVSQQVSDCYTKLSDWNSVLDWQESFKQMQQSLVVNSKQTNNSWGYLKTPMDINFIRALSEFEVGNVEGVKQSLELIPGMSISDSGTGSGQKCGEASSPVTLLPSNSWDMRREEEQLQRMLVRTSTQLMEQADTLHRADAMRCIQQAERQGDGLLRIFSMVWPPILPSHCLTQLTSFVALRKQLENRHNETSLIPLSSELVPAVDDDLSVYNQLMRTIKLQRRLVTCDKQDELALQLSRLQLAAATVARKQLNTATAEDILLRHVSLTQALDSPPESVLSALVCIKPDVGIGDRELADMLKMEREGAKLLRTLGKQRSSLDVLANSIITSCAASSSAAAAWNPHLAWANLNARSLLTLVKWLQLDPKLLASVTSQIPSQSGAGSGGGSETSMPSPLAAKLNTLLEMEAVAVAENRTTLVPPDSSIGMSPMLPETEGVIGRLLHLSTMQSTTLAKAWFSLAAWCYKWGRKAVDNASNGYVELSVEEENQVLEILPKTLKGEERKNILSVLSHIHSMESSEEDIIEEDQSMYDDGTETTRKQLVACCSPGMLSDQCVHQLISVWREVVKRVYHYYRLSAKAYFTFLHVNGLCENPDNEGGNVISTLRLLRLLVKHASELREVLETGLSQTPTNPWKGIIPQLFSRLSHPESYVRQSISELLCRIALDTPHLIVYPAVVGSSAKIQVKIPGHKGFFKPFLSQGEEQLDNLDPVVIRDSGDNAAGIDDEDVDESSSPELQACLSTIVDALSKMNPQMIAEVQLMVQELRRVTLLWDELWLGTLNQQAADVQRRLAQLEAEVRRVQANVSLSEDMKATVIREKHRTIMKPTLYLMEHLNEITSQAPQTPQEKWFQATYGKQISTALQRLRDPPDPSSPHDTWSIFKCIHHSLQQRAQKRNSLQLKMDEISPRLAALKNSVIPMPGLTTPGQVITIESVHNTSQILPTKTKPKKLIFIGSDGKRHPYLFKGLEDLHLDERIMQFLSIVNNMFTYHKRSNESLYPYRARHYSVTPLGPRSGLIQWVEGATALFSLYKKWQQREALAHSLKSPHSSQQQQQQPTIARPSEVFFSKLTPILKEKGLDNLDNRKDWPVSVLRQVLDELMDETPDDLLAKEMWCCSSGPGEWWQLTQSYARSTAVMSMIGYIIGLGDRHLDNVLVDLATGEVVHIDYNVCFEKGKSLRVPEKVPFRMTANIETALGLTGVEGTFRVSSEHVIKTMRKGRESLLTLLEAFVYDPLVDWTTGGDAGFTGAFYGGDLGAQGGVGAAGGPEGRQSKQQMERDITSSMFAIRLTEMESAWATNKSELMTSLPELSETVQEWLKTTGRLAECADVIDNLNTVRGVLEEAQVSPQHSLHSLLDRYSDYLVLKESRDQVMTAVGERINEYSNWHSIHTLSLEKLQSPGFQAMCAELSSLLELSPPSFAAASSFLQGAGQFQIVAQCEQLETEICSILEQRRSLLHAALQILHTYSTLVSQFGSVCAEDNRTFKFLGWLQEILSDFTSIKCEEVMSQYHDEYNPTPAAQLSKAQIVLNIEGKLKNHISDLNAKLIKLMDRRAQESNETVILEVQAQQMEEALKKFLQDNGVEGENSLTSVIVSALFTLNKRYLQMEVAAAAASDRLMDLTSRDGDWFLEELCSMSANVNQFLATLSSHTQTCAPPHVKSMLYSLGATHNVYIALQELNMNFRSIILPEAVKLTQSQDCHLLSILSRLQSLTSQGQTPLDTLVSHIELMHRNALMGINDPKPEVLAEIERLRLGYSDLLHQTVTGVDGMSSSSNQDQLTSGQMLLMGFDGLFTRLESDFAEVLDSVAVLDVPAVWKKVDTVREAKSMQLSNFSSTTRPLLVSLFFLKRLQAVQEFFFMATQLAAAMQGLPGGVIYDDEQMAKPIKKFIADFVRKQVLGFPSQVLAYLILLFVGQLGINVAVEIELKEVGAEWKVPLEQLCKKGLEAASGAGQFQHRHLSECTAITSHLDTAWRKLDLARRLDTQVGLMKGQVQRCQPQLARFQWLHEDVFTQAGRQLAQMAPPNRGSVLAEMKKAVQLVVSQESALVSCEERYSQMEASIIQRLRWAAGANPSLNSVLDSFEKASTLRKTFIEEETQRMTEVNNLCQGILHLEALRTRTQEASAADTAFIQLLNQCSECSMLLESTCSSVADIELQIISLKPLTNGEKTDAVWARQAVQAVDKAVEKAQADMELIAQDLATCQRGIREAVAVIKGHLSTHHKLMSDIRSILKTLAKLEEQDYGEEILPNSIRSYLANYKNFSEKITLVLKIVVSEETRQEEMRQGVTDLLDLQAELDNVYGSLMEFAPSIFEKNVGHTLQGDLSKRVTDSPSRTGRERDSPPLAANNSPATTIVSAKLPVKKDKISRDPKTGKAVQERNWYAVGVWRRVKMKLEGRDPDPNKKMTVAEQVEHVIQEAKNPDNLAVLYEGWTPWV